METTKITIIKTEEIEVNFPIYRKSNNFAFYIYNEKKCVNVCKNDSIQISDISLAYTLKDVQDCTVKEFTDMYLETMEFINDKVCQK